MASALNKRKKARSLLVQSLYEWQLSDNDVAQIMALAIEKQKAPIDREYYREAMQTISQESGQLDAYVAPYLKERGYETLDPIEQAILRLACYELLHRLDIPYKVVINEALENAKKFGGQDSHKYVNGVLDKLALQLRQVETIKKRS